MRKIIFLSILLFGGIFDAVCQKFDWECKLKPVEKSGFYNVLLSPEISTHLNEDFRDIRLYDEQRTEVPYLLRKNISYSYKQLFREYTILSNSQRKKCCTQLVLQNQQKNKINNISLFIRNADVQKTARLSGSDDGTTWYVIKDKYYLESIYNDLETYEVKLLNFPLSNYEFYKLEISDSLSPPLNIIKAGYYDTYFEDTKYLSLPEPAIAQKDSSNKHTYIKVNFPALQYVERLKINLEGPVYYLRNAEVALSRKDKEALVFNPIKSLELKSNSENVITLGNIPLKEFYLIIVNKDNPPLKIKSISAFQLQHFLTAHLEKDKKYYLAFGNKKISSPDYDIKYFQDSIPLSLETAQTGEVINKEEKAAPKTDNTFFKSSMWIWAAIIIVILFLGYMSVKMIKEVNKK
ncbi:MAG: hypothetical protein K2X86_02620 [Cytophagaceae bacterium]|nr:hypothetical protein [Cytophagaceae bacterium]